MTNILLYRSLGKRVGQSKIPLDVTGEKIGCLQCVQVTEEVI